MSVGRVFKLSGFCQFVNVGQPFPVKFSGDTDQLGADQWHHPHPRGHGGQGGTEELEYLYIDTRYEIRV